MKHFLKIAEGVDVIPLLTALSHNRDLWNKNLLRTTHPDTPHKQVNDIWLRFNDLKAYEQTGDSAKVVDEHESVNYPAFYSLPEARELIFQLMGRVRGERLGRCILTKLSPGKAIDPHVDGGEHAAYYERYHIVLQSLPGSVFNAGDESVHMRPGEVWWFDNAAEHSVINNSADDRIHLIVDIKASK